MSVLSVQAVAKRFGERVVFSEVSLRLAHGDRVGLVGPNGVGKTTLLRIAAGLESADAGNVALARGTRIGFMEQEVLTEATGTVEEHALGAAADQDGWRSCRCARQRLELTERVEEAGEAERFRGM